MKKMKKLINQLELFFKDIVLPKYKETREKYIKVIEDR